jgi:hypothetical protein
VLLLQAARTREEAIRLADECRYDDARQVVDRQVRQL